MGAQKKKKEKKKKERKKEKKDAFPLYLTTGQILELFWPVKTLWNRSNQ